MARVRTRHTLPHLRYFGVEHAAEGKLGGRLGCKILRDLWPKHIVTYITADTVMELIDYINLEI